MSKGHSPLLTHGFSPILKGFPCTFLVFFTCNTLFFSQFYDVKAFIFITFELFHQNVLLDSSSIFHTSSQILLARTPRGVQNIRLTRQPVQPTTDPPALCGSLS